MTSFRSFLRAACAGLFAAFCVFTSARAATQVVDTSTEKTSGFTNGQFAPFYTCTTLPVNAGVATTLNGQPCVKFEWHQANYDGTRTARGTEACSTLQIQKEGWYGFYIYLPDPGYPMNKEAGVAQWFANNSTCSSWTAMLILRNNDLTISHRGTCGTSTNATVYANFPRNRWVSIVTHVVASHLNAGQFEIYVDGVSKYSVSGINFGFDHWTADDALESPNNIGLKFGQYDYDDSHFDTNEVRTSYYTNVTQIVGNPAGALDYIRLPVVAPSAPPAAPTGVVATGVASNRIDLSWDPASGASAYNVYRSAKSGGPYNTVATGLTARTYSDQGLSPSTSYFYIVSAANQVGTSPDSAEASATTLPPSAPVAPTKVLAVAGPARVSLSWTGATDATSYSVWRANTPGGPYTSVGSSTATDFTDATATIGTTYYYVVSSVNPFGESPASAEVSATPTSDGLSYWPLNETAGSVTADVWRGGSATLGTGATWTSGAINNAVRLDGSANGYVNIPAGVVDGVTDFTVSAWVNLNAAGNWARLFDFGTGDTNYMMLAPRSGATGNGVRYAIRTPSITERQITGPAISVGTWTHLAVTQTGTLGILYINGVEVARNTAMTLNPSSLGSTTVNQLGVSKFPANPNLNGAIDDLRIYKRALTPQEIFSMVTAVAPAPPTGLTISGGAANVQLTWTASPSATSYNVKRGTVSGGPYTTIASNITDTSYLDTAATGSGTTYYYVVTAKTGIYESAPSNQASIQLPPTGLLVSGWNGRADLSWSGVTGATSYTVKRASVSGGPYTTVATPTVASYSDIGLTNGTTYYYVFTATTPTGTTAASDEVAVTPVNDPIANTWSHTDIGAVGFTGNSFYDAGVYTVYGSGADIWNAADAFHFIYQPLTNDGAIVARVVAIQNTNNSAKAGVMMRNAIAANSAHVTVDVTPAKTVEFLRRPTAGANTTSTNVAGLGAPRWVRVVRSGNSFSAFSSPDGIAWAAVGTPQTIVMDPTINVGLAVNSHNNAALVRGTFDSVNIASAPPVITSSTTAAGSLGSPLSYTVQATNKPYIYTATPLPAGLIFDPSTGLISGVPTTMGTYNVTLGAINAMGTGTANLAITVAGQTFASWASAHGLSATNNSPTADPDGDGVPNQIEQILGLLPLVPDSAGLPVGAIENGRFVFRFNHDKSAGTGFVVQQSSDLLAWTPLGTTVESSTASVETLVATLPLGAPASFVRLASSDGATTTPVGYVNQPLAAGTSCAFGILLDDTAAAPVGLRAGKIESFNASTLTNNAAGWTGSLAVPSAPWAVRLASGAAAGKLLDVTANTSTTLTVSGANLTTLGVAIGDSFELVPLDTLGSLFGPAPLDGGTSAATADVVQLRSGAAWVAFYYDTNFGHWRRTTGAPVNSDDTVIRPGSAMMVVRRGGSTTLTLVGRVLGTTYRTPINNASTTAISAGFPMATTLGDFGLQNLLSGWRSGTTTSTADSIGLYNGSAWVPYVYNGAHWQTTGGASSDAVAIPAGAAILIQRPGSAAGTTDLIRAKTY